MADYIIQFAPRTQYGTPTTVLILGAPNPLCALRSATWLHWGYNPGVSIRVWGRRSRDTADFTYDYRELSELEMDAVRYND